MSAGACWCSAERWRTCFRASKFGLIRCTDCGTFRIDPPPVADDSEAATFYTDYYSAPLASPTAETLGRSSRFWRVVEKVPELDYAGRAILDFGCGEGQLCAELRQAGWNAVTGIDVSQSRVARAKQRYPAIQFHDGGIAALPGRRGSVEVVVMDNVIEHLPNPAAVVAQLGECLEASGKLVIMTPNMESGRFRLLGRRWTPELSPHAHIFLFTRASLTRLLEQAGFAVIHMGSFFVPLGLGFALREFGRNPNLKDFIWRLGQETGGLWGRLTGSGEMVYAVATRRS